MPAAVHWDDVEGARRTVGHLDGPGTSSSVASPFAGRIQGMLATHGERLREGQPVAWLRTS